MKREPTDQRVFPVLVKIVSDPDAKERLIRQLSGWAWHRPGGCVEYWLPHGHDTHGKSYPRIRICYKGDRHMVYAHRLFWMLREKRPVPEGAEVGHTCHNFRCVLHTEIVTKTENVVEVNRRRSLKNAHPADGRVRTGDVVLDA